MESIDIQKEIEALGEVSLPLVLVTEDDDSYYTLIASLLKKGDLPVEARNAIDGQELMDYLNLSGDYNHSRESFPLPDLILLDLHMPQKNGLEVLAEIQAIEVFKKIPVVMLTRTDDEETIKKAIGLGAKECITKPNSTKELKVVLKVLLNHWIESIS